MAPWRWWRAPCSRGPEPEWRAARPASAAVHSAKRRQQTGSEGVPAPWYRVASLWAHPLQQLATQTGHHTGPPPGHQHQGGPERVASPAARSSRPLSSCSSSTESLTTSARAMASRTTGNISAGLPTPLASGWGRSRPAPTAGWSPWLADNAAHRLVGEGNGAGRQPLPGLEDRQIGGAQELIGTGAP